jgi:hypothetical protein
MTDQVAEPAGIEAEDIPATWRFKAFQWSSFRQIARA